MVMAAGYKFIEKINEVPPTMETTGFVRSIEKQCDGLYIVTIEGKLEYHDLFEMQQLKSLNVILNGIKSSRKGGSYGYGYGYGYTYGYGYGYGSYGSYGGYGDNGYFQDKPSKNPIARLLHRFGVIKFLRRWF